MGFWLEVVTLVVPGFNDSDGELGDIAGFLSPRPVTQAQCEKIFRYAYEGKDIDF
jgi:pyruvate-formate lyase-activating enzyme